MKKRQYIHPQIEIVALTDCNELLSGSLLGGGEDVGSGDGGGNPPTPPFPTKSSKQSSFSIFDDADDIYYLEEY